jgi:glycerophosphoryl diester phosphodiesterase
VEFIAHRGASFDAPENTLAAINLAWQQGADAVEVDVQFSQDGKLVVSHDPNTKRTCGKDRQVSDLTLRELRSLDAGKWKGKPWIGERIPTLAEALATIPAGKRLFIEIKCGPECLPQFKATLRRSGKSPKQIVAIGFSVLLMKRIKSALPELEVFWVAGFKRNWRTGGWLPTAGQLVAQAVEARLDGLDLDAQGPIDARFVKKVKAAGLKLCVWTVDSPSQAKKLAAAGLDGITTNRPGWLRQRLVDLCPA